MEHLSLLTQSDVKTLVNKRTGESKFGQQVKLFSNLNTIYDELLNLDVDYVIFGISEDVGVFANHGKTGTSKAWETTLKALLNIQSNSYTNANRVAILGNLVYPKLKEQVRKLDQSKKRDIVKARQMVEDIDKDVAHIVQQIVSAGKKPIIIGGGHNNAYGNIKGSSLALYRAINILNYDAHSDFRKEEGRHSGNGFSYAYAEGFLKNYFIYGLHENYTSDIIFKKIDKLKQVQYITYEALKVRKEIKQKSAIKLAKDHVCSAPFGIEIDCDAIENISSSAQTPSGFSVESTRQFIHYFGQQEHAVYLHICEAKPKGKRPEQLGKLLAYLITDFIKA